MAQNTLDNINKTFPILDANGNSFYGLEIKRATVESTIMSLGDKISGDVYYPSNYLVFTLQEYIVHEGVHYRLVSPPTVTREGLVKDNTQLKGMTKYSLVFYHPMYMLGNFPFTDIAVTEDEENYLAQNKTFSWIGNLFDFVNKINVNLEYTEWLVEANIPTDDEDNGQYQKALKLSEVLSFDKNFISDALKTAYDTWEIPFTITSIDRDIEVEGQLVHKSFLIEFGLPSQEILDDNNQPYIFRFGQGVGLKNNSRTPKNNKIVTRIVGCGSERNIPYGYPQIVWDGDTDDERLQYPIYKGIVGGQWVNLIKHPFTRKTLMPSVYVDCVNKKVNPNADGYNPNIEIIDYYDAIDTQEVQYPNPINPNSPSVEIHQFEDIYPRLGEEAIVGVEAYDGIESISQDAFHTFIQDKISNSNNENEKSALQNVYDNMFSDVDSISNIGGSYTFLCEYGKENEYTSGVWRSVKYTSSGVSFNYNVYQGSAAPSVDVDWDDTMDDNGKYVQSYFKITLPQLDFDLYACASITESMQINLRSGACIGCTFPIYVDWDDYKANFYDSDGNFLPDGEQRDLTKYPKTNLGQVTFVVNKDLDTFGTLMPNTYQKPHSGDEFVILGISLPTTYITNAEARLDDAMKEYMLENNVHYFDYPLKFDEYFLTTHQNILAQIRNNNIVRFQYAGTSMALYIKQISIRYGDGVLPQWDITLTDDVEIVLNKIGKVTDDVSRMRVQLTDLQRYYSENIISLLEEKLSKVSDDVAQGRITFQQGLDSIGSAIFHNELRSTDFTSGLYTGRGWRIDQLGNAEMESLRVRSYLEIVELLVNRMQAQEGDTMFSDNDQVDKVDKRIDETDGSVTYILSLKEKWAGYYTPQMYGNILKGVINTLAAKDAGVSDVQDSQTVEKDGSNSFFTSWMRVIATHNTDNTLSPNQIRVVLYGDNEVPAKKNFEPCELMTMTRWGCINYSAADASKYADEGLDTQDAIIASIKRRQQVFYISTSEGRIVKLNGVDAPILRNGNYGTTLGELPDFVKSYPSVAERLVSGGDYLYAQGVVVGDFIKINKEGLPVPTVVFCDEWVDGSKIQNPTPRNGIYYYNKWNDDAQQYEIHEVRHNGGRWQCLQSQPVISGGVATYYEPKWNSPYWMLVDGNDNLTIEFVSSKGYSFRRGAVNTDITPHLFYGNVDISDEVAAEYWNWTRESESGKTIQDETWDAQHQYMRELHLTNLDMPSTWSTKDKAIFTCTVTLNDGKTTRIVDNQIIS